MSTPDKEMISAVVDESFIFRSLEEDIRATLKDAAEVRHYNEGDVLIREDEEGTEMMIVVSGTVEVSQLSYKGELSLAELGKRAVVGEVSVLTGTKRTSTVTAKEEVTVLCFSKEIIQSIVASSDKVKKLLFKLVEGRARQSIVFSK
ncbi:MAG: cyclic nucleotide-binding domain-containing protein [Deltaproteobacteria bacterium]|nr:cyclic nucleotide-binding domain-containing protein [Deltaproteobacteria bacterium]MBN2670248.1 cyclic nucleotide-binding domain-containing protein [Deltaproteobacteria bacterium]